MARARTLFWCLISVAVTMVFTIFASPYFLIQSQNNSQSVEASEDLTSGVVTEDMLATSSVTNPKIAIDAVTTSKISIGAVDSGRIKNSTIIGNDINDSFMKHVILDTDDSGSAMGWQLHKHEMTILDKDVHGINSVIIVNVDDYENNHLGISCEVTKLGEGDFTVICSQGIEKGNRLNYLVINK